jgi:hypothetical protein
MRRPAVLVLFPIVAACLVASCATSIPVTMTKPSEINMTGVRKIAALPVGFSDEIAGDPLKAAFTRYNTWYNWRSKLEQQVSTYLTNGISDALFESGYFTVVNSSEVGKLVRDGKNPSAAVDGYILGEVSELESGTEQTVENVKQKDGTNKPVARYTKTLHLAYTVSVYRAADGALLGRKSVEKQVTSTASGDRAQESLKSDAELAQQAADDTLPQIAKAIAPYTITEYRGLAKDTTKNPDLVRADELVKKKSYAEALAIYRDVYAKSDNFAAGFNAAILVEVMGDLKAAIAEMEALYKASGKAEASKEALRMKQTLADEERLQAR